MLQRGSVAADPERGRVDALEAEAFVAHGVPTCVQRLAGDGDELDAFEGVDFFSLLNLREIQQPRDERRKALCVAADDVVILGELARL